ncbi:TPA: hypothetical protein HA318_05675 [Candidatus Micrarchaeota archaeon]|nr:hypothetical protein [Candidatus Micrarchaeota archaeon]
MAEKKQTHRDSSKPMTTTLPQEGGKKWLYALAAATAIALIVVIYLILQPVAPIVSPNDVSNASGPMKLELFVRAGEPAEMAAEKTLKTVAGNFGPVVSFQPYFIVFFDGTDFQAAGGAKEVELAMRRACVFKLFPAAYLPYVDCVNDGGTQDNCARLFAVDAAKVKECEGNGEGRQLLEQSSRVSQYLKVRAFNSPALYVNTSLFTQKITVTSVSKAICALSSSPEACAHVPICSIDLECQDATRVGKCVNPGQSDAKCEFSEPNTVNLTVITSSECGACNASDTVNDLKALFKGLSVTEIDYSTADGAERARYFGVNALPAFVFDSSVEKGEGFNALKPALTSFAGYYLVKPDSVEVHQLISRPEQNASLTFFALSYCPYAAVAEQVLADVAKTLPNLSVEVRFVAFSDGNTSLAVPGGEEELEENKRQTCVQNLYSPQLFDYLTCRNADLNASWNNCTFGMNETRIIQCVESGRAESLLANDALFAQNAGASGSPVYLLNNQIRFTGVLSPSTLLKYVCAANPDLGGCAAKLSKAPIDSPEQGCAVLTPSG